MAQQKQIHQYLDSVGDGSGTKELVGNYATDTIFRLAPAAGEVAVVRRLLVFIEDTGAFDAAKYGNGLALVNGIKLEYDWGGEIVDLMGGLPVLTNGEWAGKCKDVDSLPWGIGNEGLAIRWSFFKSGRDMELNGDNGEELRVTLKDNFSVLVKHRFFVEGYWR